MNISRIDHLVLTVKNIEDTVAFYSQTLGMRAVVSKEGRVALHFGRQKINLHQAGAEFEPKAAYPCPGTADLCLITDSLMEQVVAELSERNIPVLEGPVARNGAEGPMRSVYIRDPDGNLIEISQYD